MRDSVGDLEIVAELTDSTGSDSLSGGGIDDGHGVLGSDAVQGADSETGGRALEVEVDGSLGVEAGEFFEVGVGGLAGLEIGELAAGGGGDALALGEVFGASGFVGEPGDLSFASLGFEGGDAGQ